MIYNTSEFIFEPPADVARARRVLIKPSAAYPLPYPVTTSRETLAAILRGIRRMSDADVILLEGPVEGEHVRGVYRALGYDFPRVMAMDVRDCTLVEVENPLPKPHALPNFWVPNVLLSCDYLISVAPYKVTNGQGWLSIANLLGILPQSKYGVYGSGDHSLLNRLDIQSVIADLYFTVPFDLGIIDARMKFFCDGDPTKGAIEESGKIIVGEPYTADWEASIATEQRTDYLPIIETAHQEMDAQSTER